MPEPRQVSRFADVTVGDTVRLVRPYTQIPDPDEPNGVEIIERLVLEGTVRYVNPRGEIFLAGYGIILEDATFGEWFWEIYIL